MGDGVLVAVHQGLPDATDGPARPGAAHAPLARSKGINTSKVWSEGSPTPQRSSAYPPVAPFLKVAAVVTLDRVARSHLQVPRDRCRPGPPGPRPRPAPPPPHRPPPPI